ncbi:ribosomal protein L7/L12 [Streptomyces gibsoniae]|uniref:Ribosomal protein L7/L12 n=1 Tax=Streptomyces gibsoniae TaxID=3075529 RepID=A0ABU2TQ19_9ACTN|nr:ribosomal protein L7/L12 [Streptomyces sp. DSM 41699]MDT0463053.1 ribosomal protein L7/L12 [Streptomyces sp. DSM 41699]
METVGLYVLGVLLLTTVIGAEGRIRGVDRRVARIEQKLDLILDRMGLDAADAALDGVTALVREGKRIQAIKLYREVTGAGLKEAKEAVERMD